MADREQLERVVAKLVHNRFDAVLADNARTALEKVLEWVPVDATVGLANSVTARQLGIATALTERGTTVVDPISPSYGFGELNEATFMPNLLKATFGSDVFISGTNAVTEDGKLVNVDGTGNRVTGIIFGARTSIIIVGRNKIVANVDEALFRIKNMITPTMGRRREVPLPCAKTGKCMDCAGPERACNITMIVEKKPPLTDLKIIMVDEDLGLAWDPAWPEERINRIREKYEQFDWRYIPAWREFKGKFRAR